MPRQYGYMENGVFTPISESSGSNAQNGIGQFTNEQWALLQDMLTQWGRRNANAVPGMPRTYYATNNYSAPRYSGNNQGQGYLNIGRYNNIRQSVPRQWYGSTVRVGRYNNGNGYAPRPYATRAPWAPNQPYYETVIGSNGQPVTMRFGEYAREQPIGYEIMHNSQGIPVQVPVYAPMNNSAMPVRVGTDIEGRPYGSANINSQAAFPQQTQQRRIAQGTLAAGVDYPDLGIYWDYSTNRHVSGTPRARDIADVVQNRVAITETGKVPVTDQTTIVTEDAIVPVASVTGGQQLTEEQKERIRKRNEEKRKKDIDTSIRNLQDYDILGVE